MKSILFVCTGNICRSPSADAIMRHLVEKQGKDILIDSCGTHGYHVGEPPDSRSIDIAAQNGIEMSFLRARKLEQQDFEKFDALIAMDNGHLATMQSLCPPEYKHKLSLFLNDNQDVPDPYYGSMQNFEDVFDLIYQGCEALLTK